MDKPLIGITPSWDNEKSTLRMYPGYMNCVIEAGGIPVILPLTDDAGIIEQLARQMDGFLFTGGPDIAPSLYGEETSPFCGFICDPRDAMELKLFPEAVLRMGKPCLGICRGIQVINVALEGTLYQDIPSQTDSLITHAQQQPGDQPTHAVEIFENTPMRGLFMVENIHTNSLHHQAIKRLADRLSPMAVTGDGLIEAVYMRDHRFMWGVQWHPEAMSDNIYSQYLFKAFIAACR